MLIGTDHYGSILQNGLRQGHPNEPLAQNSAFSWIISGKTINISSKKLLGNLTEVVAHHCVSNVDLNKSIQNLAPTNVFVILNYFRRSKERIS